MWRKILLGIAFAFPCICMAGGFSNYYRSYKHTIAESRELTFYASCSGPSGVKSLYLEPNKKTGLLVEKRGVTIVNLASVLIKNGRLLLSQTNGGIYSYARVQKLLNYFASQKFSMLKISSGNLVLPPPESKCPCSSKVCH